MHLPPLMLGGVEIVQLSAGAADLDEEAIGGSTVLRMSNGAAVKMTRWEKMSGTITGLGHQPPGLDGLNYKEPLELRSTQINSMQSEGLVFTLPSTPRPDKAPWAYALTGRDWVDADVETADGVSTVTAVPGARFYQVWWCPVYSVFARRPPKSQSNATAMHGWSIPWEEA